MARGGITEKRLNNKRFKRTEDAILRFFFDGKRYMNIGGITKKIGVARSTFYYHHHAVSLVMPDYEKFILQKYKRVIKKVLARNDASMRNVYLHTLIFMMNERRVFGLILKIGDKDVLKRMVRIIGAKVKDVAKLPKNSEKIFAVYASEVAELMTRWGMAGFKESTIERFICYESEMKGGADNE